MNSHFYRENSFRIRQFNLKNGILKISGKAGFSESEFDVDLADIAPHFERVRGHNHGAFKRSAIYIGMVAFVALLLRSQTGVSVDWIMRAALVVTLPGIITVFRFLRPIELVQFRSQAGVVVFDVIRAKKQAKEFERYIELLRAAIIDAQRTSEPNLSPQFNAGGRPFSDDSSAPETSCSLGPRD